MLTFKPTFSLYSFIFMKRLFSSSLSAINVVVSCVSEVIDISPSNLDSSLCFIQPTLRMMYSAYKLNNQSDNIQPWRTPFPIWNLLDSCYFGLSSILSRISKISIFLVLTSQLSFGKLPLVPFGLALVQIGLSIILPGFPDHECWHMCQSSITA